MIFSSGLLLLCLSLLQTATSDETCDAAIDVSNPKREPRFLNSPENIELCDSDLDPDKWYYLGGEITKTCVDLNRCSTFSGIWYKGNYPKGEEIVTGDVCAKTDEKNCCGWKRTASVKKCPKGYIYKLAVPSSCPMSYCVGENVPCPTGKVLNSDTGVCVAIPTLEKPVLGAPYISHTKEFGTFKATMFSVDCQLKSNSIDVIVDGKLKVETTFRMNDEQVASLVVDYPVAKVTINESYLVGHIGKTLTCECRLFYDFGQGSFSSKTEIVKSSGFNFEVHAVDASGNVLKEMTVEQGVRKEIFLQSTFPITYGHCFRGDECLVRRYSFVMKAIKKGVRQNECQVTFENPLGVLVYKSSTPIKISTLVTPGVEHSKHLLAFNIFSHLTAGILFQGYLIAPIQLIVVDNQKQPTCHSVGDPHFSAFSKITFDNYQSGDFNLVSTTHRTFQIQIRQIPCYNRISCNCGIIAREGNNLVGINSCDHRKTPLIIDLMRDSVNPSATIKQINNEYHISFVSGIKVKVNFFYESAKTATYLNVYVWGLKHEHYEGICAANVRPSDFDIYRIPYAQSFFKSQLPPCVNEVFQFPICQCQERQGDSASVFCEFDKQSDPAEVVKFENICGIKKSRRRRRSVDNDTSELISQSTKGSNGLSLDDVFKDISRENDKAEPSEVKQMSLEEAMGHCSKVFGEFQHLNKCKAYDEEGQQAIQQNCQDDVQLSGSAEIANTYLNVLFDSCITSLEKEVIIADGEMPPANNSVLSFLDEMTAENAEHKLNASTPWKEKEGDKKPDGGGLKPTHYIILSGTVLFTGVVLVSSMT